MSVSRSAKPSSRLHLLARAEGGADWRDGAACVGEDPELFFPTSTSGTSIWQIEEARGVCRRCPVTTDCLAWALDARIED